MDVSTTCLLQTSLLTGATALLWLLLAAFAQKVLDRPREVVMSSIARRKVHQLRVQGAVLLTAACLILLVCAAARLS